MGEYRRQLATRRVNQMILERPSGVSVALANHEQIGNGYLGNEMDPNKTKKSEPPSFSDSGRPQKPICGNQQHEADETHREPCRNRLPEGVSLAGRYTIKQLVGAGGIGEVYRAYDETLQRDVAAKVLSGASESDLKTRRRFTREIRSAAALSHPNIMSLYDVGDHEGTQFAIMELVPGRSLRTVMDRGMSVRRAVEIAAGVAAGLAAAHEIELMHRDIKPENVMVSDEGHAKVLDFGLARSTHAGVSQRLTQTSMIIGTVPYMSPEQAEGRSLSCSTDIFSLGTMLFEMLTGVNPFQGSSLVQTVRKLASPVAPDIKFHRSDLPDSIAALVTSMLQLYAEHRPSAKEVLSELQSIALCRDSTLTRSSAQHCKGNTVVARPFEAARTTRRVDAELKPATTIVPPDTHYARCGDVHIAYQVFGEGPIDLVIAPGFISNIDNYWATEQCAAWLRAMGRFARVAIFDKRGTGLSDRVSNLPTMEERMEDVRTVMDAAGFESAALLGISEGCCLSALFAAHYPERCDALILHGGFACFSSWFEDDAALEHLFDYIRSSWGSGTSLPAFAPGMADDEEFQAWWGKFERLGANPGAAIDIMRLNSQIDIRDILPAIRTPTLVVRRDQDVLIDPKASDYLAEHIPNARLFSSPGQDHIPFVGDAVEGEVEAIAQFLQELPDRETRKRVLATMVSIQLDTPRSEDSATTTSTRSAAIKRMETQVLQYQGSSLTMHDDLFVAAFDGPVRAIRCAKAIANALMRVHVGVHIGEVSVTDERITGNAVGIAMDIARETPAGEVHVSRTVKDLTAGAGLVFDELAPSSPSQHAHPHAAFRVH